MATLFVRHRVRDYDAWHKVYEEVAGLQKAAGITEEAVYRSEDNPYDVLVYHRFGSLEQAHAFVDNPQLHEAMNRGGVDETSLRVEFYE